MVKDFQEFQKVVAQRLDLYTRIPEEHLNAAGREVRDMYRQVDSDLVFADTAAELLVLVAKDPKYHSNTKAAAQEFRAMVACLTRLANGEA